MWDVWKRIKKGKSRRVRTAWSAAAAGTTRIKEKLNDMKYSLELLIDQFENGEKRDCLFFWRLEKSESDDLSPSCFSQWSHRLLSSKELNTKRLNTGWWRKKRFYLATMNLLKKLFQPKRRKRPNRWDVKLGASTTKYGYRNEWKQSIDKTRISTRWKLLEEEEEEERLLREPGNNRQVSSRNHRRI